MKRVNTTILLLSLVAVLLTLPVEILVSAYSTSWGIIVPISYFPLTLAVASGLALLVGLLWVECYRRDHLPTMMGVYLVGGPCVAILKLWIVGQFTFLPTIVFFTLPVLIVPLLVAYGYVRLTGWMPLTLATTVAISTASTDLFRLIGTFTTSFSLPAALTVTSLSLLLVHLPIIDSFTHKMMPEYSPGTITVLLAMAGLLTVSGIAWQRTYRPPKGPGNLPSAFRGSVPEVTSTGKKLGPNFRRSY
ncbi:MAG: hypothetical protein ABEK50_14990 [bacterium]